jgi:hypothetical protein
MIGITDIQNDITGDLSAILAKVLIDGHDGPLRSLDRLPVVESNND